jgi:aspartyl aminopeptidase
MYSQLTSFLSFSAVEAIAETVSTQDLEGNVNCIALFNHEEVGSVSSSGAESSLIPTLVHRLSPTPATVAQSIARSFLISADMTHAVHPSYENKHEENHKPKMNGGIVIKTNAKQRYTTDAIGSFIVRKLVERRGGKVQDFEARNDMSVTPVCVALPCPDAGILTIQAMWKHCWSYVVQDRYTDRRRWQCNALHALHPGDGWVRRCKACD